MRTSKLNKAVISTLLILTLPGAHARDWTGNVSAYIGQKSMSDTDWPQLDKQQSLGILVDIKQKSWPVSLAVDIIGSADVNKNGSQKDEGYTLEHHVGVRKIFDLSDSSVKPYVGGGIAFVYAKLKNSNAVSSLSEADSGIGGWVGGGMYLNVTPRFNLGVDVRYSEADVTLLGIDRKAGGLHTGITAGYHW